MSVGVGEAVEEDDEPFPEKMARLTKQLEEQFAEGAKLEKQLSVFGVGGSSDALPPSCPLPQGGG